MRKLQTDLSIFDKFGFEYAPVGVKFLFARPEEMEKLDRPLPFCEMIREAQRRGTPFYFSVDEEDCYGTVALGMKEAPAFAEAGLMGERFGVYQEPRANERIYQHMPRLPKGTVNYVAFSVIERMTFEPDLLILLTDPSDAEIIMRAVSYSTGELWETKKTPVMSCAWLYTYPFMSGKVNYMVTGMSFGSKAKLVFPEGRLLISIPWDKIPMVVSSLGEMTWVLPSYTEGREKFCQREERVRGECAEIGRNP